MSYFDNENELSYESQLSIYESWKELGLVYSCEREALKNFIEPIEEFSSSNSEIDDSIEEF